MRNEQLIKITGGVRPYVIFPDGTRVVTRRLGEGWPIREFYAQLKPRNMTTYTAEEAMLTCTYGVKHAGPWEPHEILPRRKDHGPRKKKAPLRRR